jgi:hypothetical protein
LCRSKPTTNSSYLWNYSRVRILLYVLAITVRHALKINSTAVMLLDNQSWAGDYSKCVFVHVQDETVIWMTDNKSTRSDEKGDCKMKQQVPTTCFLQTVVEGSTRTQTLSLFTIYSWQIIHANGRASVFNTCKLFSRE